MPPDVGKSTLVSPPNLSNPFKWAAILIGSSVRLWFGFYLTIYFRREAIDVTIIHKKNTGSIFVTGAGILHRGSMLPFPIF